MLVRAMLMVLLGCGLATLPTAVWAQHNPSTPAAPPDSPAATSTDPPAAESEPAAETSPPRTFDPAWVSILNWRSLGPASMGGRVVDLAVVESNPSTFYVATASGGLFKTTNNGTTFAPVFERETTVSIGDVCIAPSDPNVVWVGTGEHNGRNSVSWGDGVYKSTDGGKTWRHIGLSKSFQIGRIAIHPTNPDVVYVGALGRLWGPNLERGVYKTTDGGANWEQVLYVDDKTGCVDVAMSPADPETLIVAMYDPHLYATEDFGQTWQPLRANLPEGSSRVLREDVSNQNLLYAGTEFGIWVSLDRGGQWTRLNNNLPTVAIHEIAVHPTQGEIVAATHGRSLWALDVAPLRELTAQLVDAPAHLFRPHDGVLWAGSLTASRLGHRHFVGQNPQFGTSLDYYLAEEAQDAKDIRLEILDIQGNVVRQLKAETKAGLHRVGWDLRSAAPPSRPTGNRAAPEVGPAVDAGTYLARLSVGERQWQQPLQVQRDPEFPSAMLTEELEAFESKQVVESFD